MLGISSTDEKHGDNERSTDEDGTEIRLEYEEKHNNPEIEHIRKESVEKISDLRMTFLEKISKIDNESELHKLHRLERERKERNIDPSPGSVIGGSYKKYEDKRKYSCNKDVFRISFKKRIGSFYNERKKQKTEKYMGDIFEKIEIIIRLNEQSFRYHKGGYLEGRINAYGADHNHPEHHERENDEKYGIIDVFRLHRRKLIMSIFSR